MHSSSLDVTVIVPTLGRVQQAEALHGKLHKLNPNPARILFVFQRKDEWIEFSKLTLCGSFCSTLIKIDSVVAARNMGLEMAQSEFLAFIDDDCSPVKNDWLLEIIRPLSERNVALVTGPILGWDGVSGKIPFIKRAFLLLPPFLEPIGRPDSTVSSSAMTIAGGNFAVKRIDLGVVGGFSNKFSSPSLYEETELALRLCRTLGKAIWFNADAKVVHEQSETGGMRTHQSTPSDEFIISQRRILIESFYGKSRRTTLRLTAYRIMRSIRSVMKTTATRGKGKK